MRREMVMSAGTTAVGVIVSGFGLVGGNDHDCWGWHFGYAVFGRCAQTRDWTVGGWAWCGCGSAGAVGWGIVKSCEVRLRRGGV